MQFKFNAPAALMFALVFGQLILLAFFCAGYVNIVLGLLPILCVGVFWFVMALVWCYDQMK